MLEGQVLLMLAGVPLELGARLEERDDEPKVCDVPERARPGTSRTERGDTERPLRYGDR